MDMDNNTTAGVSNENPTVTRPLTAGEMAVGITFNPANNPRVAELKQIFARAFDIVEGSIDISPEGDDSHSLARRRKMRDAALHEIISAQMWSVKVVTLK